MTEQSKIEPKAEETQESRPEDASSGPSASTDIERVPPPIGWRAWWSAPSLNADGEEDGQTQLFVIGVAALIYLTQLGFGLWDCWEPHYAETARMMLVRNDWLHPFWSYAYLLSKPILMFWYMAASMSVFGINEWAIRLPFALHAVLLIWSVYFIVSRLFNSRAGLISAAVIGTMPLTTFLGRQAIADILVATYITMALGFFALAVFGHKELREKALANGFEVPIHLPYLYFGYAFLGLSLLAKGLLGPGLPVVVVVGYLLLSWDWRLLLRIRIISGSILMFAIALPWYIHMISFPGRNIDDGKTFLDRFILHDNFYRLFRGVHGERGHFAYFIRQLGYASGMWIGFLPLGLLSFGRFRQAKPDVNERLYRFLFSWWFFIFLFFSFSQTKFHHYVFPLLPISAILIGVWLERYLTQEDEPLYRFGVLLALGIFGMVIRDVIANPHHLVNMFVYKYSRPYPWKDPMLLGGELWRINFLFFKGVFRPSPQTFFSLFASVVAAFLLSGYFYNARRYLVQGLVAVGLVWATYNAQVFMIQLTPHWSQKPLFELLKKDSLYWRNLLSKKDANALKEPIPKEPLLAFRMNWRGEKFYSLNRDLQIMGTNSFTRLYDALKRHKVKHRPVYFLIENTRMKALKRAVGTFYQKYLRIPMVPSKDPRRYRRQRQRIPRRGFWWVEPTKRNIGKFERFHNKYLLVKLLPAPLGKKESRWQRNRDVQDRTRGDEWRRRWWYDKRAKKWRTRSWWRRRQRFLEKQKKAKRQKLRQKREKLRRLRLHRRLLRFRRKHRHRMRQLRHRRKLQGQPTSRPAVSLPRPAKRPAASRPSSRPSAR